ncbi:hypothetical protein K443DRAFT_8401 [Laccaria amethystina LaAM-08-1]|uniref:Uncharacterized protein n=1 Tax=Laccaria amethystina LaAM-08-1 TaxID=1095629 RepID=A0A0C9XD39_9AGAR|nr:hypothetical protein K443DRAFT_8401 [Laccaria amethystina LaAM-08-1]
MIANQKTRLGSQVHSEYQGSSGDGSFIQYTCLSSWLTSAHLLENILGINGASSMVIKLLSLISEHRSLLLVHLLDKILSNTHPKLPFHPPASGTRRIISGAGHMSSQLLTLAIPSCTLPCSRVSDPSLLGPWAHAYPPPHYYPPDVGGVNNGHLDRQAQGGVGIVIPDRGPVVTGKEPERESNEDKVDSGEGLEEDESSSESDSELVSGTATLDFLMDTDGVIDREVDVSQADEVDLAISTSTSWTFLFSNPLMLSVEQVNPNLPRDPMEQNTQPNEVGPRPSASEIVSEEMAKT